MHGKPDRLLEPGRSCWRIASAARGAFLVDGEAYFRALHDALGRAREQIIILAWDVDSRLELLQGDTAGRAGARCLEDRLHEVLDASPDLRVFLLDWDFSVIYALEREWMPVFRLPWARHRRLWFELDDQIPYGASHHQKVVVIDDAIAFCGGIDPTLARWDSPRHERDDPRRLTPAGLPYQPFHDVQMLVAGDAAASLGELARARWRRATGQRLGAPPGGAWESRWPAGVAADFEDLPLGIARTEALYGEFRAVREVERLYLDMISTAGRYLYFENQYLSSGAIVRALCDSLAAPAGPEIVLVVPLKTTGWLEEATLGKARDRAAMRLREADARGRLRLLCPINGDGESGIINVHSKLLIADDRWVRVGSANLSNRSMALDTECDLVLDAGASDRGGVARQLLARLLGEHTGAGHDAAERALAQSGGPIAAIDALQGGERRLVPLPDHRDASVLPASLDASLDVVDPETPLEPAAFSRLLGGAATARPVSRRRRFLWVVGALAVLGALSLAWRYTPLVDWLSPQSLVAWRAELVGHRWAPLAAMAAFPIGSLLVLPVTGLIVAAAFLFGPLEGFAYSVVGVAIAASLNFAIGALFGRGFVRRVAGPRVNGVSRRLAREGVLAMAALRLVPVAPFTVVNLVAGASHIGFRDYLFGTLLGMAPGMGVLSWFSGGARRLVTGPSPAEIAIYLSGLGVLLGAVVALRVWLRSRAQA